MTTTTKVLTNVRIDSGIKQKAIEIADQMWLSFSTVISLLVRKFILEKRIEIGIDEYDKAFDEGIRDWMKSVQSDWTLDKLDTLLSKMKK